MSLLPDLRTHINSKSLVTNLVGTRIYPGLAPTGTAVPYITYLQINRLPMHYVDGSATLEEVRIQFTIWGATLSSVDAIGEALRNVLDGFSGTATAEDIRFVRLDDLIDQADIVKESGAQSIDYQRVMDFVIGRAIEVPTLP